MQRKPTKKVIIIEGEGTKGAVLRNQLENSPKREKKKKKKAFMKKKTVEKEQTIQSEEQELDLMEKIKFNINNFYLKQAQAT